jgi:hypothetical protein
MALHTFGIIPRGRETAQRGEQLRPFVTRTTDGGVPAELGHSIFEAGHSQLLAYGKPTGHIGRMVEKFRARLLEVKVTHEPPRWGWEVLAGDEVLSSGSHDGQISLTPTAPCFSCWPKAGLHSQHRRQRSV